jgi:uncharacterized damage-inducible protein DinB
MVAVAESDTVYRGWQDYQALLIHAVTPLTPEQLALRPAPSLRSVGEAVAHVLGARARWIHGLIGEGGDELGAFATWDGPDAPSRTAAELTEGLETTWRKMREAFARWTPAEWDQTYEDDDEGIPATFDRRWVVWHLIEHDIHHGGEIGITLGMHGVNALVL